MRTFIEISIPDEIKDYIESLQKNLPDFRGKLTEKQNLHLTLKFLGEVSKEKLQEIMQALSEIKSRSFECVLSEIGTFNFENNPRIVWVSIRGPENLQKLIDHYLLGIFPEEKRFMSHLTIARIKHVENAKRFQEKLKTIQIEPKSFICESFKIISSSLKQNGPEYKIIKEYEL